MSNFRFAGPLGSGSGSFSQPKNGPLMAENLMWPGATANSTLPIALSRLGPTSSNGTPAKGYHPPPDPNPIGKVDVRSERVIATLLPQVQPFARALVSRAAAEGLTIRVTSGTRTYAEQDALYAQGRTATGNKVTNAKGGQSNHNFGIAFDISVIAGNKLSQNLDDYDKVGLIGKDIGLEWGGGWTSLVDRPHFELRPSWAENMTESGMLAELRRRTASSTPIFDP